jgi:RNA polymerase sigma-70 factor (ECF subfamily)
MDEESFRGFYQQTANALRAYVARALGDRTHADDIVQESFVRYVRSPPDGEDYRTQKAFLFRIASNLLVDHWRQRKRDAEIVQNADSRVSPDISLRLDMERVFGQLSPQQRQLLWLAYVEEADHRQIAAILGLRERSIRVLLHRARAKLATALKEKEIV